jgi:phage virion morphogenesis protein
MADDLTALEDWAGALLMQLNAPARRAAASDIGRELRRSQQKRIREQRNPDGSPFEPRKPRLARDGTPLRQKKGRIKRQMFMKLRTARFFKVKNDAAGVVIGFSGRVSRLARVHQEGQRSKVAQGQTYQYPVRQLLGLTAADREMIRDKLLEHLTR